MYSTREVQLKDTRLILPLVIDSWQEKLRELVGYGSSADIQNYVPIDDYERLEDAKFEVNQARQKFDQISSNDDSDYADSVMEELKCAEEYLNSLYKLLKSKTKYKN
jgi:hypothetical protein